MRPTVLAFGFLLVGAVCINASLGVAARAETLQLLTEEYPPYNYTEGETVTGAAVEQAVIIAKELGTPYTLELVPWARAYATALNQPWTCVFTTARTSERETLFKWVEPLLIDRMVMVRKAGTAVAPPTLQDAKAFSVGTQRGDVSASFLQQHGFTNIDVATDIDATLRKLLNGRVDLIITSQKTFEDMRAKGTDVEQALILDGQRYGIACNKTVPDTVISAMQATLARLIKDGTQDRIFAKYGLRPNR